MRKIIGMLPEERQTMLFSATQTRDIRDLAAAAFRRKPLYLGVDDDRARSTAARLEQGYVMVPADKRFLLLFTFLKKNRKKKVRSRMRSLTRFALLQLLMRVKAGFAVPRSVLCAQVCAVVAEARRDVWLGGAGDGVLLVL